MIKISIFSLLFIVLFGSAACAQNSCNKLSEPSLGISFCAPPKWTIRKDSGGKYQSVYGEKRDGLTPNMNIQTSSYKGELSQYVKESVDYLLENKDQTPALSIELESQSEFSSTSGRGYKIVYNHLHKNGYKMRTIQYVFNGDGDTKAAITATLRFSQKDELEKLFDGAAKTYQLDKVKIVS